MLACAADPRMLARIRASFRQVDTG